MLTTTTPLDDLVAHYPVYVAARQLWAVYTQLVKVLDGPSRSRLADVLDYVAACLELIIAGDWSYLTAPQVIAVQETAVGLRDLAIQSRRWANTARNVGVLTITPGAQTLVAAFSAQDPAQGAPPSPNPTADCLTVIYGLGMG